MARIVIGAAATALLGAVLAVAISFTALGGWTSRQALPNVTLGGNCVFSQSGSTLTLTAPCVPTSTIVLPANKILNGNAKLIDGSFNLNYGSTVIRTTAGSSTNQVLAARINAPAGGTAIFFNGPGSVIKGNTINQAAGCDGGEAIHVVGGLVSVTSNTVNNLDCSYGVHGEHSNLTVSSNNFNGEGIGSDTDSAAVYIVGAGATVSLNKITNTLIGIDLLNSPTSSVKGNTLDDVLVGILVEADGAAAGPVTISTNTVSAYFAGVLFYSCGTIYNSTITKNVLTDEFVLPISFGILFAGCFDDFDDTVFNPDTIQNSTITWNKLTDWVVPILTFGAPGTLEAYNTILP